MNIANNSYDRLYLSPGQTLGDVASGEIWRVEAGRLVLECMDPTDGVLQIGLATIGDLICIDAPSEAGRSLSVRAMTSCRLQRESRQDTSRHLQLLAAQLAQSRRQCVELLHMRSGSATERVKRLLLLLSDGNGGSCELPPLKEMAALVDSAPETVSRVIGNLRRLDVLHKRQPSRVSVDRAALGRLIPPSGMTAGLVCVNRGAMP